MPTTIRLGSSGPDVSSWQRTIGITPVDGSFGPITEEATKSWQAAHGLVADGVVGPKTWAVALPSKSTRSGVPVAPFVGFTKLSRANQKSVVKTAQAIAPGEPDAATWLATIIDFESGRSWATSTRNPYSRAVGLIQFVESTARLLGTTTDMLSKMTFAGQLAYVKKYFDVIGATGKIHSLSDMYLAVFTPRGIGQPPGAVLYREGEKAYEQNQGLDHGDKGFITVGDVTGAIHARLASVADLEPVIVNMGIGLGTIVLLAFGAWGAYKIWGA